MKTLQTIALGTWSWKGTYPIIGVTTWRHVVEAASGSRIVLSEEEIPTLETLAAETGVDTRDSWKNPMA